MMTFLTEYPIYVVLICATLIWIGIATVLVRLNSKVDELEKRVKR